MFIIPLVVLFLAGAVGAGSFAYFNSKFTDINALSTPPPELSSESLGGEQGVTIDTGPAQEAIRQAEAESEDSNDAGPDVASAQGTQQENGATSEPRTTVATSDGSVTLLLMGVDAGSDKAIDVGVRPDSLAILHLDGETGACRMLSIPRDTRTELPGYGQSKINHALAIGGIPYQVLVTENLTGIEIDHYGLINFAGIEDLVDAVGGVTVINDAAFSLGSSTFAEGEITLDGKEALLYARFRGDDNGDFGRIGRQQQIIRALISQTSGMDVATGAYNLLSAVEGHIKTDLSMVDLIGLANDYRSTCSESTLEVGNLEGTVETLPDPLLNMDLSFVVVDPAEIDRKLDWLLGDS